MFTAYVNVFLTNCNLLPRPAPAWRPPAQIHLSSETPNGDTLPAELQGREGRVQGLVIG